MPTWKINLKEQTATSVKERYHLQSQKLTSEWMEGHGGIEAERKLINGVSDGGQRWNQNLVPICFMEYSLFLYFWDCCLP